MLGLLLTLSGPSGGSSYLGHYENYWLIDWLIIYNINTLYVAVGRQLLDKRNEERDHISDVIRQEFADKIVATDEENKRLKTEIAELKARHKVEVERAKAQVDVVAKAKDNEMEEVHKR